MIRIDLTDEMFDRIIDLIEHKEKALGLRTYKQGLKDKAKSNAQSYTDLKNNLLKQKEIQE